MLKDDKRPGVDEATFLNSPSWVRTGDASRSATHVLREGGGE